MKRSRGAWVRWLPCMSVITLSVGGCATIEPDSLEGMRRAEANRAEVECLAYYKSREPRLVLPSPSAICARVENAVRSGRTPVGWMI